MAKSKKEKKYRFRNFVKEIKRVKWPTSKESSTAFRHTIIFVLLAVILFAIITTIALLIWSKTGVGL